MAQLSARSGFFVPALRRQRGGRLELADAGQPERAILFWSPPWPLRAVQTVNQGLEYCFEALRRQLLLPGAKAGVLRRLVGEHVRDLL